MKENNNSYSSQKFGKFSNSKIKLSNTSSFESANSNISTHGKEDISSLMNKVIKKIEDYKIQNDGKIKDEEISYQIKTNLFEINKKICNIIDDKNNTFLHILAEQSKFYPLKIICDTYYTLLDNETLFFKWFLYENTEKLTVLDIASIKGNKQILLYLFSIVSKTNKSKLKFENINNKKNTIFHYSAKSNQYYSILFWYDKLQKYYPKIKIFDTKNDKNLTPLHCACFDNNYECAKLLIDLGSDINAVDIDGKSVLTYAINSKNIKIIELLLLNGANGDKKDSEGKTPFNYSIDLCDKNIQLLLNKKDKINTINNNKNYFEIVLLILIFTFFIFLLLSRFIDIEDFEYIVLNNYIYIGFIFLGISFLFVVIALLFISYFLCCIKHKQHLKKKKPNLLKLYEKYNNDICIKCLRRKKETTYHCIYCNLCIENWRFHSYWLNTCISEENIKKYKIFFFFIIVLLITNIISEIFFLLFAFFDKNEYKKINNLFNNFFYLYYNEEENKNDIEERNKIIKQYFFIPFFLLIIGFFTIITLIVIFKLIKRIKKDKNFINDHHNNINNLKIGLIDDEEDGINNEVVITSSAGASISD